MYLALTDAYLSVSDQEHSSLSDMQLQTLKVVNQALWKTTL